MASGIADGIKSVIQIKLKSKMPLLLMECINKVVIKDDRVVPYFALTVTGSHFWFQLYPGEVPQSRFHTFPQARLGTFETMTAHNGKHLPPT